MNHTRFPKEDHLPDWARRDNKDTKGDRVYNTPATYVSSAIEWISNLQCQHHQDHRLHTTTNSSVYFQITFFGLFFSSRHCQESCKYRTVWKGVCVLLSLWLIDRSVTEGLHPPRITRVHSSFQIERPETEFTETSVSCFSQRRQPRIAKCVSRTQYGVLRHRQETSAENRRCIAYSVETFCFLKVLSDLGELWPPTLKKQHQVQIF